MSKLVIAMAALAAAPMTSVRRFAWTGALCCLSPRSPAGRGSCEGRHALNAG
jgi:hypothetical protein